MAGTAAEYLVDEHLDDAGSGWSQGTIGAIAEFVRDPDEPVIRTARTVVTPRGGIRLVLPRRTRLIAYETPTGPHDHWNHTVALCLPVEDAHRSARTVVTELGPDVESLQAGGRADILFDLGLGTPTVDACIRTDDPALITTLRAATGTPLFAAGSSAAAAIVAASPPRVFVTACGRVEVYATIPPPDGRSPDGPHTHLLPHLLRAGRTHPATAPIPAGFVPSAHLYPAHPSTDRAGRPIAFVAARHRAFGALLARFGDARQAEVKAATIDAVRAGLAPEPVPAATGPVERAAVAVALRQLAHTDGPSVALAAWRARLPPGAELLDPEGDPNGG